MRFEIVRHHLRQFGASLGRLVILARGERYGSQALKRRADCGCNRISFSEKSFAEVLSLLDKLTEIRFERQRRSSVSCCQLPIGIHRFVYATQHL